MVGSMDTRNEEASQEGVDPAPVVTVVVPFDRVGPNLSALAFGLSMDPAVDRVIFIDYRDHAEPAHTLHVEALRGYCRRLDAELLSVRIEPNAALSDIWNLAGVLARHHGDLEEPSAPWVLVLIDPYALPIVGTVAAMTALCADGADVVFGTDRLHPGDDGQPIKSTHYFDGQCFAVAASAGTGILLTTAQHDDRRTCAHDFLSGLKVEAEVWRLDGYLHPG